MSIHNSYNKLNYLERETVDCAFDNMFKFIEETYIRKWKLNNADGAERVVEAIATWFIESKEEYYRKQEGPESF